MKRIMHAATLLMMGVVFSVVGAQRASAVQLSLGLIPDQSHITINGTFNGLPSLAQDGTAGTVDPLPLSPSNRTTFQGSITVNVDDLFAPSSIQIVSSDADADTSGTWYAQPRPYQDLNGDGDPGDFGLPGPNPGDGGDSEVGTPTNFAPATDADWGIRVFFGNPFNRDVAYGGYRDIAYNVTSGVEGVNGLGQFSSLTQHFEPDGFLDYWVAPGLPGGGLLGRTEANTGDGNFYDNTAPVSSYTVTPIGGGLSQVTLLIPILVDDMGDTLRTVYTGQFMATAIIPEPTSLALFGLGGLLAAFVRRRAR
jgi:hypothetical protein